MKGGARVAQAIRHQDYLLRRLHTLAGVIPVGLFLLEHLFTNATVLNGASAFNQAVAVIQSIPLLHVVEFVFIFIPIIYHGVFGLYVAYTSGYNAGQYSWQRNLLFVIQRITGVITFVFIIFHLSTTRFSGHAPTAAYFHQLMQNQLYFWFMIIGVVAATFHFANGLWSFCIHWGITVGARAQRLTSAVTMVIFVALASVGVASLIQFVHLQV